ncbi:MAG: non-heme iron oxygenase ferredoxin subunit [Thiotrichales bacterium]|nr:MAG: non-heme iron oxygenase ferredoxin subunit [Thiotrichales bacterium]
MSDQFTRVASLQDLRTRKLMCVKPQGLRIALAYIDGKVFAIDDLCSHEDASLSKGSLHGECIKCPLHGSRFDLNTGAALDEPADEAVKTYPVRVEGEHILVRI